MSPATINPATLTTEQKALLTSPYGFGRHILGLPLMDQPLRKIGECRDGENLFYEIHDNDSQKRVVDDLDAHGSKVACRTANGAGKTTMLVPTATFWFMSVFPRAKVVITSGVDRQVREQLFPALHAQKKQRGDRNRITQEDLAEAPSSTTTAFDAIRLMRPQWLNPPMGRVASSNASGGGGGATELVVYIDDIRQQSSDDLKTVKAATIVEMRYLDQNRAIQMRGPGHEMGAIEITTVNKRK